MLSNLCCALLHTIDQVLHARQHSVLSRGLGRLRRP
eukprot:COSAG01_NODE_9142_length_2539_cov_219.856557_4_plen_35_part_01